MSDTEYWVVFRGKPKTKGPGVITSCCFHSQQQFIGEMSFHLETSDIVFTGTSYEEARAVIEKEKDIFIQFYACLWEAFDIKTKEFHSQVFNDRVEQTQFLDGVKCPNAILVAATHLLNGRMDEPVPIYEIYRMTSILPKNLGGVLEEV